MKRLLTAIGLSAGLMFMAGCASDGMYGRGGHVDRFDPDPVAYDGYYDGYYGAFYDGYWADDGGFYYSNGAGRPYRRDGGNHFHHEAAQGFTHVHGQGMGRRGRPH